jgi:predicted DNA-binding transcriptional regulator AlpA
MADPEPIPYPDIPDQVLTSKQVAKLLHKSVYTLSRMRTNPARYGQGPSFVKLSAYRVGYRMADLQAWVAQRKVGVGYTERGNRARDRQNFGLVKKRVRP